MKLIDKIREKYQLSGLIIGTSLGNKEKIKVSGRSMMTQKLHPDMHYRIGGQSIPILTTLFLILVDKNLLNFNDKIGHWLPKVPNGNLITLQMLCNMRSGLEDVINNPTVSESMTTTVFREWTTKELLHIIYHTPPLYPPDTKFYFSHITNMLLLGQAMVLRTSTSLKTLIKTYILKPLGLNNTEYKNNQVIQSPVFHAFSNIRIPHYEDSTYWNASWGSYATKINSNASDVLKIATAIGSGSLISEALFKIQISNPDEPASHWYGMGIAVNGIKGITDTIFWSNQNMNGYIGIWAYIPSKKLTINIQANSSNVGQLEANVILEEIFLNQPLWASSKRRLFKECYNNV